MYGAPPPAFGGQGGAFGAPPQQPAYGQQQPSYGQPQPHQPQQGYGFPDPNQGFGAPPPNFGAPPAQNFGAPPAQNFGAPPPNYGQPPPAYGGSPQHMPPQGGQYGMPSPGMASAAGMAPQGQPSAQPQGAPPFAPPPADTNRDASAAAAAAGNKILRGFLVSFQANAQGEFWPLHGGRVAVGRANAGETVDVSLADPTISSRHAALLVDNVSGVISVEDTGSTNGTYVNDEHLGFNGRRELRDGDRVRFGGYTTIVKVIGRLG
jgi:hypothetical protein